MSGSEVDGDRVDQLLLEKAVALRSLLRRILHVACLGLPVIRVVRRILRLGWSLRWALTSLRGTILRIRTWSRGLRSLGLRHYARPRAKRRQRQ